MKKILFSLLMVIATIFTLNAQTGLNGINYQAVARNTNGTILANQSIKVKITILGGSANGTLQYQENHGLSTNQLGLFTLQIGKGTPATGVFANVPWQNSNQFLKVELAIGNSSFSDLGTTQLMSVPYALFAANSSPGSQGPAGAKGDKGDKGDAGLPGASGIAGTKGDKGDQGLPGIPGVVGAKGNKGDIGTAGMKGDKGDQGLRGLIGAPGIAGAKGDKGDVGASGTKGDKGDQGLQGIPGVVGAKGNKGDIGTAGMKGDKGDQGLQGIAGTSGIAGAKGEKGDVGITGASGQKGNKGDQGLQGIAGTPGIAGAKGDKGDVGASGNKGDKGDQGLQGIAGTPGIAGLKGDVGASGQKGDKGDQGLAGSTGSPGATGPIGPAGPQGIPGTISGATAGGDLSGVYPDPTVVKLQGKTVSNVAPVANQYLKYDGAKWLPAEISGGSGFILPYAGTERSITVPLFSITNTGGTPAIKGRSESDGVGVLAESSEGTALYAKSNESNAAQFIIDNVANTRDVIDVRTNGSGSAIRAQSQSNPATIFAQNDSEEGKAIEGTNDFGVGVKGTTNHSTGVGVLAAAGGEGVGLVAYSNLGRAASMRIDNAGNGHDVLTVTTAGTGVGINVTSKNNAAVRASNASNASAVEGSNSGTGAGVSGYSEIGTAVYAYTSSGIGLQAITQNGKAAKIEISRNDNANTVLDVSTAGTGTGVKSATKQGPAIEGINSSTALATYAVRGEMSATNGSGNSAGVRGENKNLGNGGYGVYGSHAGVGGIGVYGSVENGIGVYGESKSTGNGVYATSTDGIGLRAISQNGAAGTFASGTGLAIKTTRGNVEVNGKINVISTIASGIGGAAIEVNESGAGIAGFFNASNTSNTSTALVALNLGSGAALVATSSGSGISGPQTNNVAIFKNFPNVSATPINVARIDNNGRGFFNGGTQTGGADIAEALDITGSFSAYEPGDILVIATDKDRTVEKSNDAYSNLVAGVYATKPGVLLTEEHIDADISSKVPMGVIGIIPTKVCLEGGAIKRGDMLVTSSIAGVAMKADLNKVRVGQVLGKAMQDFSQAFVGKINVLVSIK